MKKMIWILIALLSFSLFAGCSNAAPQEQAEYAMRLESDNGLALSLAHTPKQADSFMGWIVFAMEFEEEGVERQQYYENEGVFADYYAEGNKIVGLRLEEMEEAQREFEVLWHAVFPLADGTAHQAYLGDQETSLRALFDASATEDLISTSQGTTIGFTVAYDEALRPCAYADNAPYKLHLRFENGRLNLVVMENNQDYLQYHPLLSVQDITGICILAALLAVGAYLILRKTKK